MARSIDQNDLTAAHRTLPMPSDRPRHQSRKRQLASIVRVNDRGPFAHSRIIDVSKAAAEMLDMIRSGVASVRVEILADESKRVKEIALNGGSVSEQIAAMQREPAASPRTMVPPSAAAAGRR